MENFTWSYQAKIESLPDKGCEVVGILRDQLESMQWSAEDLFKVHLSLEEAVMNAIKHGNDRDPSKNVTVECQIGEDSFRVLIEDEGVGFVREAIPDPTASENLLQESGRGLTIMENFMTQVTYHGRGNVIEMIKIRSKSDSEKTA